MGYCLHFDGLLDRIIEARDLYLVKNGIIFPNSLSFKCGIIHDEHFLDHKINYWDDVYGVPMGSMKKWISHEPLIRIVDPEMIVSKVTKLLTFNLQTISYSEAIKIDRVF
jgi:protein arginine N-methyltransferase 1